MPGHIPHFIVLGMIFMCYGQKDTNAVKDSCAPEIIISYENAAQAFCLNTFNPGSDSCANLAFTFKKQSGISIRFRCNANHSWSFDTVLYGDSSRQNIPVKVNVLNDLSGSLTKMQIFFNNAGDSSRVVPGGKRNGDVPQMSPAGKPPDFSLQRTAYDCVDRHAKAKVIYRVFTYPPGYMRREPVYNYPELSMFHYGGAVRMPASESIRLRGIEINVYHIQHPSELKYDAPDRYIEEKKNALKTEGEEIKIWFFRIRPLK
jgi:hypothetical protein